MDSNDYHIVTALPAVQGQIRLEPVQLSGLLEDQPDGENQLVAMAQPAFCPPRAATAEMEPVLGWAGSILKLMKKHRNLSLLTYFYPNPKRFGQL